MKIIVTGAAGFMGSYLFDFLKKEGHEVLGLDNYSIGRYEHEDILNVDLVDAKKTAEVVEDFKPEIVVHMAAWAHEGLSQFCPIKITENNYNATLNVLIPSIRAGVKKFVFTSSMSVYGAQEPPFDEDMETAPEDIYAIAKAAGEMATEILADVHGFDYVIIRPHNVYGPRQNLYDPYRNVAGIFMNRVMHDLPPIIYGDGEQTRAFSFIEDVTPYVAKAALDDGIKNTVINIGPIEEYTINYLAECVLKAFESDVGTKYLPDRPREVKHAYCTNDKAIKLLGYSTSTDFEEGVKKMAEWALSQGPQEFQYLEELELTGGDIPDTWLNKTMSK